MKNEEEEEVDEMSKEEFAEVQAKASEAHKKVAQWEKKMESVTDLDDIKQVIVIRKDLKMRRGKEIAQGDRGICIS
jgi:5-bromo-4-chloroindolyl phosphate hydrolysis protein